MADTGKTTQQEPSMEEILSSIRRIIADEDTAQPGAQPGAQARATLPDQGEEDVLELTEIVEPAEPAPPPAAAAPIPPAPPTPAPPASAPPASARSPAMAETSSLVSPAAAETSTNALARLTRAAVSDEQPQHGGIAGLTVEKLLIDLLTPMLRDWLDQNLSGIVERVVEQEVKKLARRAEML